MNEAVKFSVDKERFYSGQQLYTGVCIRRNEAGSIVGIFQICEGVMWGMSRKYDGKGVLTSVAVFEDVKHGYQIEYFSFGDVFAAFVEGEVVEGITMTKIPHSVKTFKKSDEKIEMLSQRERDFKIEHCESSEFVRFYRIQEDVSNRVVNLGNLNHVQYVAGADVAYNEREQRMVGALVVLDAKTLQVIDQTVHEMKITFPYVPGLFSFREVPPLIEAYKKLKVQPDLIVCDGHGVAHPKGAGMASHLGVELGVPTIGCAKTRFIGKYGEVEEQRGSYASLMLGDQEIGRVLRTQDGVKPMFVSVGHMVGLNSACEWVLKLCAKYRQPETTRKADALVRTMMKERTEVGFPEK